MRPKRIFYAVDSIEMWSRIRTSASMDSLIVKVYEGLSSAQPTVNLDSLIDLERSDG